MPTEVLALTETAHGEERGWRKGEELIDALPYIDELTPEHRLAVDKLIQEEVRETATGVTVPRECRSQSKSPCLAVVHQWKEAGRLPGGAPTTATF